MDAAVLVWALLGLFNLSLAALLSSSRPRRLENVLAAVITAGNGLFALDYSIWNLIVTPSGRGSWWPGEQDFVIFVNTPTLFALVMIPFLFPPRAVPRAVSRGLLAACGVLLAVNWVLLFTPGIRLENRSDDPILTWTSFVPFFVGLAVGAMTLVHTYLTTTSPIRRDQARFILTAIGFKLMSYLTDFWGGHFYLGLSWSELPTTARLGYTSLCVATWGGVSIAIIASRLRGAREGRLARPLSHDLFIIVLPLTSFLFPLLTLSEVEYLVIRPILITYGILKFQLLDIDAPARRGALAGTLVLLLITLLVYGTFMIERSGVSAGVAVAVALGAAIAVAALLLPPFLRVMSPVASFSGPGREEIYRAALEEAAAVKGSDTASSEPILRALRARLQISEREHASMQGAVQVMLGRRGADFAIGRTVFGRYAITATLGEGGFGRTFLAQDQQMTRRVVIKATRTGSEDDAKRMLQEAQVVAQLRHPNVVTIHDVERVGEDCFLVLEYVEGGSVADALRPGPLPWTKAVAITLDVLAGLAAAHKRSIIHRDIKPANILLVPDGPAKLADFGIARIDSSDATFASRSRAAGHPGTLQYMSPEQVRGAPLDPRSDLYSVAATLYHMLAGRPYLELAGESDFEGRIAVLEQRPKLPIQHAPEGINRLLRKALSKAPQKRPATAEAMASELAAAASRPEAPAATVA